MIDNNRHPASFRDPAGNVFLVDGRIIRGLSEAGQNRYLQVKQSGLLDNLTQSQKLVSTHEIQALDLHPLYKNYLEHELIPYISYPYEWPFLLLKDAALLHLSIQLDAIEKNIVLIDASAYNVQFRGVKPIFIDVLSFRPYQTGELWHAHQQFCQQFLNPLLLYALRGVPYQEWYRGALEGIPTASLANLLPFKSWFSLKLLVHVLLPAWCQRKSDKEKEKTIRQVQQRKLSKAVYKNFLMQLYHWIDNLRFKKIHETVWENYTDTRIYHSNEVKAKRDFIAEFINHTQPKMLWDLGCNDGEFAELALQQGTESVIGFDVDLGALEKAVRRAKARNLNFLPLYQHITNPSPRQGWLLQERDSMVERGKPNAIIALAFIHHLAIGHNIPLREAVLWLVHLAPIGVIEFVQKQDPTVQKMLSLKEDIYPYYTEENFINYLKEEASIIQIKKISETGRALYWYKKNKH